MSTFATSFLLWGQFGPRPSSNTTYKQRDVCFPHGVSCGRTYLRSTFIGLPFLLSAVPLRGHHNQLFPSNPILCLLFSLTTSITLLFGLPLGLLQFQPHLLLPMFSLSLIWVLPRYLQNILHLIEPLRWTILLFLASVTIDFFPIFAPTTLFLMYLLHFYINVILWYCSAMLD